MFETFKSWLGAEPVAVPEAKERRLSESKKPAVGRLIIDDETGRLADAAIARAKLTGDTHISHLHNPIQSRAELTAGPRTPVRASMGIAEDGFKGLQITKAALDDALANPVELGGPAQANSVSALQAAARAESMYVDPAQVEAALISGQLPDAIAIKKAPRRPDMFVEPRAKVLSPTPMGTAADLRSASKPEGVEDDWQAAQRAVKVDNHEGILTLRTPGGIQGVEDDWTATKRVVEGSKSDGGLGIFQTDPRALKQVVPKRETVSAGMSEKRRGELRRNAEQLILELRKMIDTTEDAAELKPMRARLAQAEKFFDENFK